MLFSAALPPGALLPCVGSITHPLFFSSFEALVGGSDLNLDIKNSFVQTLGREGSNGMFLISNASANTCLALSAAGPEWYAFVMCRVLCAHEVSSFNIATELRVEALVQMQFFTCIYHAVMSKWMLQLPLDRDS